MIKISVVVITYNEERNLARCLESVKDVADEVIVVDSFSTDATSEIAERQGARVISNQFIGYSEQKNFATDLAANDWILSLDADEALSPALRNSVLEIKKNPDYDVYQMPRLTNYCGKWIKHCGWYPDKQTRLYNRTKGRWAERKVHEFWQLNAPDGIIGSLDGDILHYSFRTLEEHLKKIEKYSELSARAAVEAGKNTSLFQVWGAPKWHFVNEFFIKAGFLDGFYGFVICRLSAYATFIKYSKIRQYNLELARENQLQPS